MDNLEYYIYFNSDGTFNSYKTTSSGTNNYTGAIKFDANTGLLTIKTMPKKGLKINDALISVLQDGSSIGYVSITNNTPNLWSYSYASSGIFLLTSNVIFDSTYYNYTGSINDDFFGGYGYSGVYLNVFKIAIDASSLSSTVNTQTTFTFKTSDVYCTLWSSAHRNNVKYLMDVVVHVVYEKAADTNTNNNTTSNKKFKYYYLFSDLSEPTEFTSTTTIVLYYNSNYNKTLTLTKKDTNGVLLSFETVEPFDNSETYSPIKFNKTTNADLSILYVLTPTGANNSTSDMHIYDLTDWGEILIVSFVYNAGSTYVEPTGKKEYYCIDTNEGDIVDATSLYYKGNTNNIYKTIEQKDNTLFLGNYKEKFNNREFFNTLTNNKTGNITVSESTKTVVNAFNTDSSTYQYVPNTLLSSLDKHVFKKREHYNLGLVFITSTGLKSSVYPISELFSPKQDAYFTGTSLVKPVCNVILSKDIYNIFNSRNIIGVIPVYSVNFNPVVKALGIASPTLSGHKIKDSANIDVIYSWYLRSIQEQCNGPIVENTTASDDVRYGVSSTNIYGEPYKATSPVELQGGDNKSAWQERSWTFNYNILSVNSPEVECATELTESELQTCKASIVKKLELTNVLSIRNLLLLYDNAYTYSTYNRTTNMWDSDPTIRVPSLPVWHGFDPTGIKVTDDTELAKAIDNSSNYIDYYIYPWQRSKLGAEGINFKIDRKDFLDYLIFNNDSSYVDYDYALTVLNIALYRDLNDTSILRLKNTSNDLLYMGNIDFIYTIDYPYFILGSKNGTLTVPKNKESAYYSGYNEQGVSRDPIIIRYKVAPHILVNVLDTSYINDTYTSSTTALYYPIIELYDEHDIDNSTNALEGYIWIKCGEQVAINEGVDTTVTFEEGDFFYGRFDTLRVYPFSDNEANNITEVVSANIFSRVNLDLRTDRNRGINTPTISPVNFNLFNEVYNLLDNFFTYNYIDLNKVVNARNYVNSILWSLSKVYGADTDNWCNIQASNTIDLDGDKGEIIRIIKDANDIIVFLETGISLLLYNENIQILTELGLPVELANSGKVTGKRYITTNIGCQNIDAVDVSLNGIYFIDGINKALYVYNGKQILDVSGTKFMKSWALNNLNQYWWLYYDCYSLEINLSNAELCLSYHTLMGIFQAFLSYENIKYHIALKGRVYLYTNTFDNNGNKVALTWLKNGIKETIMFNNKKELQLIVLANPNALIDKTFTNIEYRADCFDKDDKYLPWNTFDKLRAWDEYLDTGVINLTTKGTNIRTLEQGINLPSNLKKKFRIWRIQIPRVLYNTLLLININAEANIIPEKLELTKPFNIDYPEVGVKSRDRMRNMWLMVALTVNDTNDYVSMILHDIIIQYII